MRSWDGVRLPLLLVALATACLAPLASGQVTQQPCPQAPEAVLFAEWETSLENLAFDGNGSLFVSDVGGARIVRFGPEGKSSIAFEGEAHGLAWGPDDRLYTTVSAGADGPWDVLRSTDATVTAFEPYSRGLPTYNGMTFDGAGNLYVSDDSVGMPNDTPDLVRVPASDPARWLPWTPLYGPNGLVYDEQADAIYTVITADQASPVLRFSTTDSGVSEVVTYLSYGFATLQPGTHDPQGDPQYALPKGLDDLTLGPDRLLYVVGHLSGELLRVDPALGTACVLASGLEEPTSVRIARGFGPHGGKLFVTTWGGTGITGITLGLADQHPAGKVWMFDVGFGEPSEPAVPTPGAPTGASTGERAADGSSADALQAKDTPLGPLALLALAAVVLARRR